MLFECFGFIKNTPKRQPPVAYRRAWRVEFKRGMPLRHLDCVLSVTFECEGMFCLSGVPAHPLERSQAAIWSVTCRGLTRTDSLTARQNAFTEHSRRHSDDYFTVRLNIQPFQFLLNHCYKRKHFVDEGWCWKEPLNLFHCRGRNCWR